MSTIIKPGILKKVEAHLVAAYPHEACGFLLGKQDGKNRTITHEIEVENRSTENRKRRFVIDPLDYLKAEKFAAREGLELLGVYHSHPDHPAIPSVYDLASAHPHFSYFITSVMEGTRVDTRSYRLIHDHFEEEQLIIPASASFTPISV